MSPQYVKAYVKTNKNDYNDAEAICEAVARPNMRFVPIKTVDQQDIQMLHRVRSQLVKERTALANQIRGLLGEYGIVLPQGIGHIRNRLVAIVEDQNNQLTELALGLFFERYYWMVELDNRIEEMNKKVGAVFKNNEACQRLERLSGVGMLLATAFFAAVGNAMEFKNGRQLAAWVGLAPRQHSTGGKTRLGGISKRGDRYLRTLLIHGARSVVYRAAKKDDPHSRWINNIRKRRGENIACVAVANKNARILWALMAKGEEFRPAV